MNTKERLYVWLNNGTFVEKNGCTHPQDIIAAAIGCSERTVIRCVQQLEAEGRLRVHRPRRRGACNTYYVSCWNPARRSGVLNVLEAIRPEILKRRRERDERLCQIKRTAKPSKGSDPVGSPVSPRCTQFEYQRCGRERFEIRRSTCMDQRRRPSHIQAAPDLTSQPLLEELARKDEIIRTLQLQLNKSMENEAGALAAAKAAGNALIAAKGQLTKEQKKSAKAGQVQQVVDHWRLLRPRTGPEFGDPGTKSFAVIEKALVLMSNDPAGPVAACCEAIDGLHMAPWESYGKRYATKAKGRTLRRDLEHALGDEQRIAKCRAYLRWLRAGGAERAWELYQAAQETADVLGAEVMDLLGEQRFRREEPAEWAHFVDVGGVRTRVSEKANEGGR